MSADGAPIARRPAGRIPVPVVAAAVAACVAVAAYAVFAAVGMPGGEEIYKRGAFSAVFVLAAGTIALRAARDPAERVAWIAFAGSFAFLLSGWVAYWVFVESAPDPVYPSVADALWLIGYLLSYYAVVMLFRARATRFDGSVLFDGAIGVLALTAVGSAVLIDQVVSTTGGSASAVLVGLMYPLADVVLIGTVLTVFLLKGWRAGWSWALIGTAFAIQATADWAYVFRTASGTFDQAALLDAGWPLGAALIAAAAWVRPDPRDDLRPEGWRMLAVPGTFTLLAIAVLVYGDLAPMPLVATLLAMATLVVAAARCLIEFRRMLRLAESHAQALDAALRDHLTGLFNHRAFHESLDAALERARREGTPLCLVMLDLVGLKETNDSLGHQAGDERLRLVTAKLTTVLRADDTAYRIGGDEFAVILPGLQAWDGYNVATRIQRALSSEHWAGPTVSIGVAEADREMSKNDLIGHADTALLEAKRSHRKTVLYSVGLELQRKVLEATVPRVPTKALATSLARAVDAKDSYTRSHCETVAELCVTIAERLGLDPPRVEQLRLAGLLHDVGKIGVPDTILQKPGPLPEGEYETMKSHSRLGHGIVSGAGLADEARWILHHHERLDGRGYPDGLSEEEIPLESKIILVADAFEAMTSERPYRRSLPASAALEELNRHAGSQFDPACVAALEAALTGAPRLLA